MNRAFWSWTGRIEARVILAALACAALGLGLTARGRLKPDADLGSEWSTPSRRELSVRILPALELATAEPSRPFLPMVRLFPLRVYNVNSRDSADVQLYTPSGEVDPDAAARFEQILGDARDPESVRVGTVDRRVMQLVFKAAYHFRVRDVTVISGYREPSRGSEGLHGAGSAIDFKLPKVPAATLAAYLRTLPRVGVGLYTHPDTQYVHLDDRTESFHWLDGSGPHRHGREHRLITAGLASRDARYMPWDDWPEGTLPEGI
jgi:uncharacterized protein YcbK (DUF882 family)